MPHARGRQGGGSRRRHQDERSRNLIARQEVRIARSRRLEDQVGHPWPAWARQLAAELERENATRLQAAFTDGDAGLYVPPTREPHVETAALLQFERDRLAIHRLDATAAAAEREVRRRRAAARERAPGRRRGAATGRRSRAGGGRR